MDLKIGSLYGLILSKLVLVLTVLSQVLENPRTVSYTHLDVYKRQATLQENKPTKSPEESRRFVTGGADNLVKIWKYNNESQTYLLEDTLQGHSDWVRDVAWSPSVLLRSYIASVSQDKTCIIWTQENNDSSWKKTELQKERFPDVLWRASWSLSGNILALSGGDNKVTLWKENLEGNWEPAGEVEQ